MSHRNLPFSSFTYTTESKFPPVIILIISDLTFEDIDYYGDDANFMEIIGVSVTIDKLNL